MSFSQCAKHLCTLLDVEAVGTEELELLVILGNGRCVDDETCLFLLADMGDLVKVLL